jgi:hypothetical protein
MDTTPTPTIDSSATAAAAISAIGPIGTAEGASGGVSTSSASSTPSPTIGGGGGGGIGGAEEGINEGDWSTEFLDNVAQLTVAQLTNFTPVSEEEGMSLCVYVRGGVFVIRRESVCVRKCVSVYT